MATEWRASAWGRLLTKTEQWRLYVEGDQLFLRVGDNVVEVQPENLPTVEITRGLLWTDITIRQGRTLRVDGLPNSKESLLRDEIGRLLTVTRRQRFQEYYSSIRIWLNTVAEYVQKVDSKCLWLTHEMQQELLAAKPDLNIDDKALNELFQTSEIQSSLPDADTTVERDLESWMCDWPAAWARRNDTHMLQELEACKALLAGVESKPLTDEQSRAVICFDNRVQVIASAGSGKTSTMVAKAVYALHRKLVFPSSIVMLAFNKSAAEELQARVALSLKRVDIEDVQDRKSVV